MPEPTDPTSPKNTTTLFARVDAVRRFYATHQMRIDSRNLSYYRGEFWEGDGLPLSQSATPETYSAAQNETFPVCETISAALVTKLPGVTCEDIRAQSAQIPVVHQDETLIARRIAATLNVCASNDEMDVTIREAVNMALVFNKGGIVKTVWDAANGRVTWQNKLPWEVFIDTAARKMKHARWIFEVFKLHEDDFRDRVEAGTYKRTERKISADCYDRGLMADSQPSQDDSALESAGLKEYVTLIEYWDLKAKRVYHLHPGSKQVLMSIPMPYGNPYSQLTFHPAIGRAEGVALVTLLAHIQRDINEMVSARRTYAARVAQKLTWDASFFRTDEEWLAFVKSKPWEPARLSPPPGRMLSEAFAQTPAPSASFDFNTHLNASIEHIRYLGGVGDIDRGAPANIRTAAEANMIQQATSGRLASYMDYVTKLVMRMFQQALSALQWAMRNPEASQIDVAMLWYQSQQGVSIETWMREMQLQAVKFQLLPFSPLMEDHHAKRVALERLLQILASTPAVQTVNWEQVTREIVELYKLRPSIVLDPSLAVTATPAAGAVSPQGEAMPEGAPAAPPLPPLAG